MAVDSVGVEVGAHSMWGLGEDMKKEKGKQEGKKLKIL